MARRKREDPLGIQCGGKGWKNGECFDCRRVGAQYCVLRNRPREFEFDDSLLAALERQQRRWWRGGVRGRHATEGKRDGRGRR